MKQSLHRPTYWSFCSTLRFAVLLMVSVSRLAKGWVLRSPYQLARGSPSIRSLPTSTQPQRLSTSRLFSSQQPARWQVGDVVSLPATTSHNDTATTTTTTTTTTDDADAGPILLLQGVIKENRGAGWYSVQVHGAETTVKYRGTNLRPASAVNGSAVETISTAVLEESTGPSFKPILQRSFQGVPPPPTIVDLDAAVQSNNDLSDAVENLVDQAYLQQVKHFMTYKKWVVFTDLHCAPSTLDTTLQVLEQVHRLAVERQAGVLFLGDWWHHRGTLRVDCLNSVLSHLKTWTVPMVLIPGNHDQVTLGGHNHGLTPLENAYRVAVRPDSNIESATDMDTVPGPLVFSHPTKFANGLFVPHIRDNAVMESVLHSSQAHEAAAIFVHADVTGAYMNDQIVSLGGVPPSMFPSNKPIYSGHFHKPHLVQSRDVSIEYLGSPYEVSLAEAQQPKALAVLDAANNWKCIERIPLSIGRKHFRALSLEEFLTFQPASEVVVEVDVDATVDTERSVVNAGDRVVLSINKDKLVALRRSTDPGSDSIVDAQVKALRKGGALVEVREVKDLPLEAMGVGAATDASELEELSLESTWKAFITEEIRREALSSGSAEALLQSGLEMIEELDASEGISPDQSKNMTDLKLASVDLEGFGPFKELTTYPLLDRGLVLLRGSNKDGGSDSNGSGKSSLAMATLWALTGSVDPRPLQDSKVSDVVNDSCKTARVNVKGALNGVDFSITRTKTFSKGSLAFFLGGEDLTTQSVKETQAAIDEKLGVGAQILARTMFHGQHAINELLEATDSKLKDELSLIVPLGFWQSAVSASRKKGRTAAKKAAELDGMHTVRLEDLEKLQQRLQVTEEALFVKEASFRSTESRLLQEIKDIRKSERPGQDIAGETLDSIEVRMTRAAESVDMLESQRRATVEERNSEVSSLRDSLNEATLSHAASTDRFQSVQRDYDSSYGKVSLAEERVQRLEGAWEIDLSSGTVENLTLPATCPTCRQPLCDSSKEHSHEGFLESMQQDISSTLDLLRHAQASLAERKGKLEAIEALRTEKEIRLAVVRAEHENRSSYWEGVINDLDSQLWNAHKDQQEASAAFSTKARQMQQSARIDALDSLIKVERETVSVAQLSLETLRSNSESCESLLADIQSRKDEQINISAVMGELSDAFGQRGVQTFVMQNVVSVLQSLSQSYLDELSDGAQRLEFALDAGDRISRRAFVRGGEGEYKERPLASLSGGQWRRCSLSITLGFAELVARRGRLRPSLCVLDEPLTHLDRSGRSDVGRVLRRMLRRTAERHESNGFTVSTILIILQDLAAEELEESFDCIDEVIKNKGFSSVLVDERV